MPVFQNARYFMLTAASGNGQSLGNVFGQQVAKGAQNVYGER